MAASSGTPPEAPRRRRRWLWVLAGGLLVLLSFDLARPPREQLLTRWGLGALDTYQSWVSPWLSRGSCRMHPTCSNYAKLALNQHGFLKGTLLSARRLARCGPWTAKGTEDWPPDYPAPESERAERSQ